MKLCAKVDAYWESLSRICISDVADVPWYPEKISDLDLCANQVLMYGSDLDADHPVCILDLKVKGVTNWLFIFKYVQVYCFRRDLKTTYTVREENILLIWLRPSNSKFHSNCEVFNFDVWDLATTFISCWDTPSLNQGLLDTKAFKEPVKLFPSNKC